MRTKTTFRSKKWTYRILLPEKKKGKARWSYDKMLIDWVRSGRTGKYLALGRTSLRSVRTPWPRAKYFPVRPSHSVNKYILLHNESSHQAKALAKRERTLMRVDECWKSRSRLARNSHPLSATLIDSLERSDRIWTCSNCLWELARVLSRFAAHESLSESLVVSSYCFLPAGSDKRTKNNNTASDSGTKDNAKTWKKSGVTRKFLH